MGPTHDPAKISHDARWLRIQKVFRSDVATMSSSPELHADPFGRDALSDGGYKLLLQKVKYSALLYDQCNNLKILPEI